MLEADLAPLAFPLGGSEVPALGARGVAVLGVEITISGIMMGLVFDVAVAWFELSPTNSTDFSGTP